MRFKIEGKKMRDIANSITDFYDEGIMDLKENKWLVRIPDPSGSGVMAIRVSDEAMSEYDKEDDEKIALDFDKMYDFIPNTDDDITISHSLFGSSYKIVIQDQSGKETRLPAKDIESVRDPPSNIPNFDYPVKITIDTETLTSFIRDSENIGAERYFISPREGMLYLYSETDGSEIIERKHWEDFHNYDIDWSKGSLGSENPTNEIENALVPEEDHGVDVILSTLITKNINLWTDTVTLYIDNHMPVKFMLSDGEGIDATWIQSPRIPTDGQITELPNHVVKERGLKTV